MAEGLKLPPKHEERYPPEEDKFPCIVIREYNRCVRVHLNNDFTIKNYEIMGNIAIDYYAVPESPMETHYECVIVEKPTLEEAVRSYVEKREKLLTAIRISAMRTIEAIIKAKRLGETVEVITPRIRGDC